MNNNKARMVGKVGIFSCGCCASDSAKRERRANKRREKQAWKRTIDNELKKMPGYRRGKPSVCFTFLADPKTTDKEDLMDMEEPNLIDGFGDFSDTKMTAFVEAMEPGKETK